MTSVERLEKIIALIRAHSTQGISVADLAEACTVPLATIQNDLRTLLNSLEVRLPFFTDQDEREEESDEENEKLLFQPYVKWFLLKSDSQNVMIHINIGEALALVHTLNFLATESPEKETLRQKLLAPFNFETEGNYRLIKGNMAPLEFIAPELFIHLENAIIRKRKVQFVYSGKGVIAEPLGLVYYSRLRCWYLAARHEEIIKSYHLSKMREVVSLSETFEQTETFDMREWLAPYWGMEFGMPISVKVRFYNRSQTLDKLRKDVAHRTSCWLREEEEGSWLMEDRIIGENEFITWLLGFGSSAELLEPKELRAKIREQVSQAFNRY